jgi:precorrin-6A/cobalt-precorrin-6A reductase
MRILLLGGTGEARALAAAVPSQHEVISSLAGRVRDPALPVGAVRIGGFGGVDGLVEYLRDAAIDVVVDATHPFAATITEHAVAATGRTGLPLLVLRRPGWTAGVEDDWTWVPDMAAAATTVRTSDAATILLTTGRRDLAVFADDADHEFVVRTVDEPVGATPPRMTLLLDRGPYTVPGELELMRRYRIDLLVTKDSGGSLTAAKLAAARELRRPVIVVRRPALPPGIESRSTVEQILADLP